MFVANSQLPTPNHELLTTNQVRNLVQCPDPCDVVAAVEAVRVHERGAQAGALRADDIHVIQVTNVQRRLGASAGALQDDLEEARVRFFGALDAGITDGVKVRRQPEAVEGAVQRAVGIRSDPTWSW